LNIVNPAAVSFAKVSMFDPSGRVFTYQDRIFRAIYDEGFAALCHNVLDSHWMGNVFEAGMIKTWVCEDISLAGAFLTLEHEKLPFDLHPSENTAYMHWLAAKALVATARELAKNGYQLKDAHPWNIMYSRGFPRFIDFGSLTPGSAVLDFWLDEFKKYFAVPIWLASSNRWHRLALDYRREHTHGFGLRLLGADGFLHNAMMRGLNGARRSTASPGHFFASVDEWLDHHAPVKALHGAWTNYEQAHAAGPSNPQTAKQKFVYDILRRERPKKVLDCAANKGFFSVMAAQLGASVASFDYEESLVDACLQLAQRERLDITPAMMDFKAPTAGYGVGLCGDDALGRFQSDIVLALGLMHHLCIVQNLPVVAFCGICMKYAAKGVILEYVDPADVHVKGWNRAVPDGYSLENICRIFREKFSKVEKSELLSDDGICRYLLYFSNP